MCNKTGRVRTHYFTVVQKKLVFSIIIIYSILAMYYCALKSVIVLNKTLVETPYCLLV